MKPKLDTLPQQQPQPIKLSVNTVLDSKFIPAGSGIESLFDLTGDGVLDPGSRIEPPLEPGAAEVLGVPRSFLTEGS